LEIDEQNKITKLFSLDDGKVESSQTLFFDGILSSEIVSLKQNMPVREISARLINYQYYDFTESFPSSKIKLTNKPLLLDFGTNSPDNINKLFPVLFQVLSDFSIFDIIAAFTYYPSLLLEKEAGLAVNYSTGILLWENVDLVGKKLSSDSFICEINRFKPT
jgi:hypothetical protein